MNCCWQLLFNLITITIISNGPLEFRMIARPEIAPFPLLICATSANTIMYWAEGPASCNIPTRADGP